MAAEADAAPERTSLLAHLGRELRERRKTAGVSQQSLAAKISYARAFVAQVELARETPSADFVLACDQALSADGALLTIFRQLDRERRAQRRAGPALLVSQADDSLWTPGQGTLERAVPTPDVMEPHVERRTFLRGMATVAGAAMVVAPPGSYGSSQPPEPWERLSSALRGRSRVDDTTVDNLEQVTVAFERLESQISPKALIGPVVGHLDAIAHLLHSPMQTSLRRRCAPLPARQPGWPAGSCGTWTPPTLRQGTFGLA